MIKILYFDTSAIIKYFFPEENGSDLIRWIVDNRVSNATSLNTSQITIYEFKKILKRKEKELKIMTDRLKRVISKSKPYFSRVFRVIDDHKLPGFKKGKDTNYLEICKKYKLAIKKNSWDARHLSSVINYLRCFAGESKPYVVTADVNLGKIVKAEGYNVINPEKITKLAVERILNLKE